jgi:hypothetical protein
MAFYSAIDYFTAKDNGNGDAVLCGVILKPYLQTDRSAGSVKPHNIKEQPDIVTPATNHA